jgi:Uma2 family endonuclease
MSTVVTEKRKYTYQDYLKTPDDKRYELIEGKLLMTPSPVTKHQRISRKIEFLLEKFVTEHDLGEIFYAPCDVRLDDENVLQPDIMFISKDRLHIIGEKNIHGAPDLVIEILSESTAYRDLVQKKKLYARFGVREYWVVDPGEHFVEMYTLKQGLYTLWRSYGKEETLETPLLKDLRIILSEIFRS